MARKYYVRISSERGEIRKFGGGQSKVLNLVSEYKNMGLGEFMFKHPHLTKVDYLTLKYEVGKKN